LIRAVRVLHDVEILHCDNIAWDSKQRQVFLLDFGHAQDVKGAKSYPGIRGCYSPEVLDRKPHDKVSDVFSVGRTLNSITDDSCVVWRDKNGPLAAIKSIVPHLTHANPNLRMTLKEAEDHLVACMPKNTLQKQTCHAECQTRGKKK